MGTPLRGSVQPQQLNNATIIQPNNARAAFQLLQSLNSETAPRDQLHIMVCGDYILSLSGHLYTQDTFVCQKCHICVFYGHLTIQNTLIVSRLKRFHSVYIYEITDMYFDQ